MADVLLAHSNHLFQDAKQTRKMQPYPPLQTMLAASVLREAGLSVAFCDVTFEDPEEKFSQLLKTHRPKLVAVCEDGFNYLSKMCLTHNRMLAWNMAAMAQRLGITVAGYGPDASDHAKDYLAAGFDCVLLGEVEQTLLQLSSGTSMNDVAGLAFRDGHSGPIRYTPRRAFIPSLDSLPPFSWDLIDIDRYRSAWMTSHGYFSLNMVTSRGCPFRCNWCAKPAYGSTYRVRSATLVAEEMRFLKDRFSPDHLWFADDIFALSNRWTLEFADAVERLDAHIPFKMQSRCDLMTRTTVDALRRAGCEEVWMGAESGSQRILTAMDKELQIEEIYQARNNLARHGIRACYFLQFGYPGEDWPEIEATIRMVRETRPDDIGVSVSYPLPGTKFFDRVSAELGQKANWSESGDLAMMFRGTFSSRFYRALAEALHLEVRAPENKLAVRSAWEIVYALREGEQTRTAEVCA